MNTYKYYEALANTGRQFSGEELKEAFLDGFLQAATMYGLHAPSVGEIEEDSRTEGILDAAAICTMARNLLIEYELKKAKLCGIPFDEAYINNLG